MSSERLNVIALISGGKDSFYSLLHCIEHGHRIVALANLFPGTGTETETGPGTPALQQNPSPPHDSPLQPSPHSPSQPHAAAESESASASASSFPLPPRLQIIDPAAWAWPAAGAATSDHHGHTTQDEPSQKDLNSFMYQTVGHEILPLYAAATGLPLYRLPIGGRAVHHERDYDAAGAQDTEETESMLPLLRAIMSRHPEANALCAGAILSTYQRTRVESIALRLGLVPLAYLWQYPVLPPPYPAASTVASETQLLSDMANAGLEARIIKVASAGLDEGHLWERVSSEDGARRVKSALRKFGSADDAAALGEGGEFETIVVDGPADLFRKRISVPEHGRKIVREGGGCSWLMLSGARLEKKSGPAQELAVRTPDVLDSRFKAILNGLPLVPLTQNLTQSFRPSHQSTSFTRGSGSASADIDVLRWSVLAEPGSSERSIQDETIQIVEKIRELVSAASLDPSDITSTIIVLRRMADFPKVNGEYGKLFPKPNPPSRVTISCGDLLPLGTNMAVYVTAPPSQKVGGRNGLHVQSRSYWAPANIGPYSQAIDVPITVQQEETGVRTISIAGQIPLIPATMLLPSLSDTSHELQIVLSLQHLWRVGKELKIQYWTSSVAYFPRGESMTDMERNAKIAGLVWKQAHGSPEDEEDANEPDPWDLKYNPEYQSLGSNAQDANRLVPDWSVLTLRQQNEPETCIPPMFAVEVEELPRQSAVEWHAHNGLSKVDESSLELTCDPEVGIPGWRAWQSIVKVKKATLVYTAVSYSFEPQNGKQSFEDLFKTMSTVYQNSLRRLSSNGPELIAQRPYLVYVDAVEVEDPWRLTQDTWDGLAIVPCRSVWSSSGERLMVVALYETVFSA
ncbi:hypothetical protein AK830_g11481 [Neonectria ditissima]|uniref:Diphthine--ammonia ligase n=1 Tax=Neonectria ditissima TaxID=78410 RepID=A0A0P7B801_9HYPO|nr:hypothetical protein AK830_g11481 [Neonectria ditissima]